MEPNQVVEDLKERVKELTCLYDISSIASRHDSSLEDTLQAVVERLPIAWKHSDKAIAEIKLPGIQVFSNPVNSPSVVQQSIIRLSGTEHGIVRIHYLKRDFSVPPFLQEEQRLLETIALEIANIIERQQTREREAWYQSKFQQTDRLSILGEITAGIAHELNTPLTNILGYSEFIESHTRDNQIKSDASKIQLAAKYTREVVKKLMYFSAEVPHRKMPTKINDLISDAIKLLQPNLQKAELKLSFSPAPVVFTPIVDPVQITQIIFNLVINSIYASPSGSTIQVGIDVSKDHWSIRVEDEGSGIPKNIQEKVFEPFFTTKPIGKGSGLGLSVVHGIVKIHDGHIKLASEPNKGTTFEIIFPLNSHAA